MKVAIIGAGDVGTTCAQRIVESNLADVVLVDIVKGRAKAKSLDLSSASSIIRCSRSISGTCNSQDISGADIVVLTAGQTRSPGQKREELLNNNAKIVKEVSGQIAQYCPEAIVIVVTNPVDVMTYLVCETTKFTVNRIVGMGGTSDCARFNMLAAAALNTDSYNVQSMIIGPHGDKMLILPRCTTVGNKPITELLSEDKIENLITETRNFGAKIVELLGKGSACYGPSAGVFELVDAVINDRKSTVCASVYLEGQYGLKDLCIGVPVKIGRTGIEEIVEIKLSEQEKGIFQNAAKMTKELINKLGA